MMRKELSTVAETGHRTGQGKHEAQSIVLASISQTGRQNADEDSAALGKQVAAYQARLALQGRRSLDSMARYLKIYRQWLVAVGYDPADIDGVRAEDFQTELATRTKPDGSLHYARKTVKMIIWAAKGFHEYLREEGAVQHNPFRDVPRMKLPKQLPRDVPDERELADHLGAVARFWETPAVRDRRTRYRLHVMAEVLYATGMRLDELGSLVPADFDLVGKTVRIKDGKGGVARLAYLSDYAAQVVAIYLHSMREAVRYRGTSSTVFGPQNGQCLAGTLNTQLRRHFGLTSHGFRHALGTHLLRAGCDLRLIQLILGHEDLKSTAIYTQVVKEDLRAQIDRYHPRRVES